MNCKTWNFNDRKLQYPTLGRCKQKQHGLRGLLCRWPSITEWEMYITAQGPRLRNDLYCVEWDVKLYYTIPYQHHAAVCSHLNVTRWNSTQHFWHIILTLQARLVHLYRRLADIFWSLLIVAVFTVFQLRCIFVWLFLTTSVLFRESSFSWL